MLTNLLDKSAISDVPKKTKKQTPVYYLKMEMADVYHGDFFFIKILNQLTHIFLLQLYMLNMPK